MRLNLSGGGASVSLGPPGLTFNVGPRGAALTLGVPGTGLSYRHTFRPAESAPLPAPNSPLPAPGAPSPPVLPPATNGLPVAGEVRSADVAQLTSHDLAGLKQLINDAARQRAALQPDYAEALKSRVKAWRKLRRSEQLPLRLFLSRSIPAARSAFEAAELEAATVAGAIAASEVRVEVPLSPEATHAQEELEKAHTALSRVSMIWDVTASVGVDRFRTRSAASSAVTRLAVRLSRVTEGIAANGKHGLRFDNANGGDLDLYPGFLLMRSQSSADYALVDLRELRVDASLTRFIEDEAVPADTEVVGHAWERANRDGSPDRRFRDNRQIPVVQYGELRFSTPQGLSEAYLVSNGMAALAFGAAFRALQSALARQGSSGGDLSAPAISTDAQAVTLPALSDVSGAHEVTVAAIVVVAAPILAQIHGLLPSFTGNAGHPPIVAEKGAPSETSPSYPRPDSTPTAAPVIQSPPTSPIPRMPAGTTTPAPTHGSASGAATGLQRLTTTRNANLRQAPDQQAPSIRVIPSGTVLRAYRRQGQWVQVGEEMAAGWMHGSLLRPAP